MIKTKFPFREKRYDEEKKEIVTTEKEIDVMIDTSIYAEERWETTFPNNAKRETLFAYMERIGKPKDDGDVPWAISILKAVYCLIEAEQIATYKAFMQMLDITDPEYAKRLIGKLVDIFNAALNTAAVDGKTS